MKTSPPGPRNRVRSGLLRTLAFLALTPAIASSQELRYEDYRRGTGEMVDGVWRVRLTARQADWQPGGAGTPGLKAHVFADPSGIPGIPGPMIRVEVGTPVEVHVTNELDRTLVLRGLTDRAAGLDVPAGPGPPLPAGFREENLRLAPGDSGSVRFTPTAAGSFFYYGRTEPQHGLIPVMLPGGDGPDGPFMGPLIVDSVGGGPAPDEQVMLITRWADRELDPESWSVSWKMFINGRAWPATERLRYVVGDIVTWRVINASLQSHPMHLHGFFFQVHARGDQGVDTAYAPARQRTAVTEWLDGLGETMRIRWVPETPGNWLFHCHLIRHMSSGQRLVGDAAEPVPAGSGGDHAHEGMAGMVMGISVEPSPGRPAEAAEPVAKRIHLYTSRRYDVFNGEPAYSFVVQNGAVPALDSLRIPGSPLVLERDQMTEIVVHNRLDFAFGVHWHGLELESRYDGVGDWSGDANRVVPPIPPGDSLVVRIDPPRSGSFMYHVHSESGHQLAQGMYGPFLVFDSDEPYDPDLDRYFMLGSEGVVPNEQRPVVNGTVEPPPMELRVGARYRLRFMNMSTDDVKRVRILRDVQLESWRFIAKDGADLLAHQIAEGPADLQRIGVGETYDFEWTPLVPGDLTLEVTTQFYGARPSPPDVRRIIVQVR